MMLLLGLLQIIKAIFDCDTLCKDLDDQVRSGVYVAENKQFVSTLKAKRTVYLKSATILLLNSGTKYHDGTKN